MERRAAPAAAATRYVVSRLILASRLPLPEAPPADPGTAPDLEFDCVDGDFAAGSEWRWYQHWKLPDGRRWVSFARRDGEFLLAFDGVLFTFSRPSMRVCAYRRPDTPLVTVRHLLLDQVIPLVLSVRGQLALHAGAVHTASGAVAFLGESGTGKSTLVASFAAAGASIISDDCLVLDHCGSMWRASGSYPGVRLWPETADAIVSAHASARASQVAHYNEKIRVVPSDTPPGDGSPLRRLYVLDARNVRADRAPIHIEPLAGRDAFLPLLKHTYRLDFDDGAALTRDLGRLASLVESRVVRRLAFPFVLSELHRVRQAIEADLHAD